MRFPIHHIGIVVPEIEEAVAFHLGLGFRREGVLVHDKARKVRIQFMRDGSNASRIELLEPDGPDSPVAQALQKGGGLNHLCYEVSDIKEVLGPLKAGGSAVISAISPAPAISDCRVVFLYHRIYGVFELVELPAQVTGA
jgi:methylmalonyl-CoA/ethylmalonyl-CoA epimerase